MTVTRLYDREQDQSPATVSAAVGRMHTAATEIRGLVTILIDNPLTLDKLDQHTKRLVDLSVRLDEEAAALALRSTLREVH